MTIELAESEAQSGDSPDPQGAADRLLSPPEDAGPAKRKRGRPRKSEATRGPQAVPKAPPVVDTTPPTEAEIAAFGMAWNVLWELVAVRLGKLSSLKLPEQHQLAEASIPVVRKYAPIAAEYGPEIALVVCVSGMVISHLPVPEKSEGSGAEVIEDGR